MIEIKTPEEISIMKEGGKMLEIALETTIAAVKPGITLLELDKIAEKTIKDLGGESSFKKVRDYRWTICACVNDVVVHGIPTDQKINSGDVVGIDCGVYFKGFHTDSAWTVKVPGPAVSFLELGVTEKEVDKFLLSGQQALKTAIKEVKVGNHIYDISQKIQNIIEKNGYSVVRTLVGHGVGRELHQDPEVPGFISLKREKTPVIKEGMVLAVEVIYNMGNPEVVYRGNDGWTIVTEDGKIAGLFEATVAATPHGALVLTPMDSGLI